MSSFQVTSLLIYIIGAFGAFGNINILIAIWRMKPRLKSSVLVGLLASGDLFCIVSEWQNATRMITGVQSYRFECFWAISPYLFMIKMQTTIMCAMAFDRLFAFTFPLKYAKIRVTNYVIACCIPGIVSGTFFIAYGASNLTHKPIPACNPPLAYGDHVGSVWNIWSVAINILTFVFSVTALIAMILKGRKIRNVTGYEMKVFQNQKRLSKSCAVMLVVFLSTICVTHVMIQSTRMFQFSEEVAASIETNAVLPAMISYSQPYYVYFWCSKLYRMRAFELTAILIYVIGAIGAFGNANILVAIWRIKPRSKSGVLVGILALADLISITFEWQNATRMITGVQVHRIQCFWMISPYLFMIKMQTTIMCAMVFDRLLALTVPLRYTKFRFHRYIVFCCIPGLISGTFFITYAAFNLENEPIVACNPPLAYGPAVANIWNIWSVTINIFTLILSVAAILAMLVRSHRIKSISGYEQKLFQNQRKLSKSCAVMTAVFLSTACVTTLMIKLSSVFDLGGEMAADIETYAVLPAVICDSQPFYVYMWCSQLYRDAFREHISMVVSCKLKVKGRVANSRPSVITVH
ncbi:hypothetical protein QR680_015667 [Steinernema hermaphroditum]|uniref:G-protein coupled receptors family 1 profile domain-containing protein n=1 Tax=Steinernema hermaphroditum TaxID=289476 RepID=A0AA39H9K4_9BILA|nr:hypothetical protein QR680_015667 [Steinernema hermaphroditum]